jgi:hypothetical protein
MRAKIVVVLAVQWGYPTFQRDMVSAAARVLKLPHPAARTWKKRDIEHWSTVCRLGSKLVTERPHGGSQR